MRPRHSVSPPGHLTPATPPWTGIALVAGAALLVYLNSLGNGFALDDVVILVENPGLHGGVAPWKLLALPYWPGPDALDRGLYRPLTTLAFAVQWGVGEGRPLLFHLLNVFLHAGVSTLLFLLLRTLVGGGSALAGALVFALHPVHVEAVANVVGQAELWCGLLVLSAALVHTTRPAGGHTVPRGVVVAGLYGAAMLFKEHAIVLPALLVLLDLAGGRLREETHRREWVLLGLVLAGVAAPYLTLRWIVLGGSLSGHAAVELPFLLDPGTRIRTALSVWPEYARLLFFPRELSAVYDPGTLVPREAVDGRVLVGALLLGAGITSALHPRSWPGWGLGFAWFFVTVLPVSNLLLPVGTLLGERTLYLPSVAVGIWAAFAAEYVRRIGSAPLRRAAALALVAVMAAGALRVVTRNPVWRDNATLFPVTLRDHPENFRAHWFQALQTAEAGDTARSAEAWRRARSIFDANPTFLTQYAAFERSRGRTAEAEELVTEALRLRPTSPNALLLRGLVEGDLGREGSARASLHALEALGFAGMAAQLADSLSAMTPSSNPEESP